MNAEQRWWLGHREHTHSLWKYYWGALWFTPMRRNFRINFHNRFWLDGDWHPSVWPTRSCPGPWISILESEIWLNRPLLISSAVQLFAAMRPLLEPSSGMSMEGGSRSPPGWGYKNSSLQQKMFYLALRIIKGRGKNNVPRGNNVQTLLMRNWNDGDLQLRVNIVWWNIFFWLKERMRIYSLASSTPSGHGGHCKVKYALRLRLRRMYYR